MRKTYKTLDNTKYSINCSKYKIKWAGKSASKFEWEGKKFFYYLWKNNFCCEEFPCRPKKFDNFRLDLFNVDANVAVEFHGDQHVKQIQFYHKTEDDFWESVERDEAKKEWCLHNNVQLVEIYQKNMPLSIEWLEVMYPEIEWKKWTKSLKTK